MMLLAINTQPLIVFILLIGLFTLPAVPSHGGEGSRAPGHSATYTRKHSRSLQQIGRPWIDNGGTWPAGFSDLDKAVETQRIFRAVLAERNRTTYASKYPDIAWRNWLVRYNITYNNATEAAYRRSIFDYNLALAKQLNELAGPEVAFGINRFSVLTQEEFLAGYTGDVQDDNGITVDEENPQPVASPAAAVIAAMKAAAEASASLALNGSAAQNGSAGGDTDGNGDAAAGGDGGSPLGAGANGQQPAWSSHSSSSRSGSVEISQPLPGAVHDIYGGSSGSGRRLQQVQLQQQLQQLQLLQADGWEEEQQELQQLQQAQQQQQQQQPAKRWWHRLLELLGLISNQQAQQQQQQQQQQHDHLWTQLAQQQQQQQLSYLQQSHTAARRLHQQVLPSGPFTPEPFCSKQVPFPYTKLLPFQTVDWLRAGAVRGPKAQPGNCSNSFAFVAASLAESTMAMQGYNGSALDISEQQLMECFPGSSCSRGGTVHVLLNYLACNGVAAVGNSYAGSFGNYPADAGTAGDYSGNCADGSYQPVITGVTGWSWVPNNEFALGQALSRTPAKVAVDASILQTYRAGYLGCNVVSQIANHATLLVGYNNQVRAGPPPAGSSQNFTFFNGTEYWMLKNSWGSYGSVDGFVYITKGCPRATPLGMLVNRPLIPTWNQTESHRIGRLECKNETQANDNCSKELLLQLAGYCAGVEDSNPTPQNSSCACSCIPT